MQFTLSRKLCAEAVGTTLLLATVVGSGIMGESLANGNDALALLGNTIATGAILYVLITMFGPISGAHFDPAVTLAFLLQREISLKQASIYIVVQIIGAIGGVMLAHLMFDLEVLQLAQKVRSGSGQWLAEGIATFGLVSTILLVLAFNKQAVAMAVGLYITAGYWFTASTSFANPAVTIARTLTDTFSGIAAHGAPMFITAQITGAIVGTYFALWLVRQSLSSEK